MDYFKDKVVFLTGASSGIGAALARELHHSGADLILTARREDRLQALARELQGEHGQTLAIPADVTDQLQLDHAVKQAIDHFGRIDMTIANAGFAMGGYLDQLNLEDYQRQFDTNVFGVLRTIYATLAELKKNHGHLVLLGSVNSHISLPNVSAYCMSKFAIRALALSLDHEFAAEGIHVTLICPGFVSSEIRQRNKYNEYRSGARDPIPTWIQMPAPKAAKKILKAVKKRRREAVITGHGKFFVALNRFFPWLIRKLAPRISPPKKREPQPGPSERAAKP